MHAAAFSRGEGRAMGSVLDEVAATDSAEAAFTLRRRGETMTIQRSGEVGMRNEIP